MNDRSHWTAKYQVSFFQNPIFKGGWMLLWVLVAGGLSAKTGDSLREAGENAELTEMSRKYAHLERVIAAIRTAPDSLSQVAGDLAIYFETQNDTGAWAKSLFTQGSGMYYGSNLSQAEPLLIQSAQLALAIEDTSMTGMALGRLGDLYRTIGKFEEGQRVLLATIRFLDGHDDLAPLAITERALANVYYSVNKFDVAIESYQQSYGHSMEINDSLGASKALSGIANCEAALKNNASSLRYSRRSIALMEPHGTPAEMAFQYFSLGDIFQELEQPDSSRFYYNKCLEFAEASQLETYILWGYFGLIEHYVFMKNYVEARQFYAAARDRAGTIEDYMVERQFLDLDLKIARGEEDYERAFELLKLQVKNRDSLLSQEQATTIEELTIQYETDIKEAENATLKSENALFEQRQTGILVVSTVIVTILLVVALILFFLFRRMRRLNQQLVEANSEKDALMGIVAHDLKSPLSQVGALIAAMQDAQLIGPTHQLFVDKMNKAIQQGGTLISELESIVELEQKESKALVPVQLEGVIQRVVENFEPIAARKSTTIQASEVPESVQIGNYKDSLDRILGNLLSNAIKFSPPASNIHLQMDTGPNHVEVKIIDQGPGIPADELPKLFRKFSRLSPRPTAGESSTGLGLYIVHLLVAQLNGSIDVRSEVGKGTEFVLNFPVHN